MIGILGLGMVGGAYRQALGRYHEIVWYDTDKGGSLDRVLRCRYIMCCLPSPTVGGKQDLSVIESYLPKIPKDALLIMKSTVMPGTADRIRRDHGLRVVSNPEFLTEATALTDAMFPELIVLGGDKRDVSEVKGNVYRYFTVPFVETDNTSAEMVKYAVNCFYALKVVYFNQIYDHAKDFGADYGAVERAIPHLAWIGNNHYKVWHKGYRGYGGKCLPKEMAAFVGATGDKLLAVADKINSKLIKQKEETC